MDGFGWDRLDHFRSADLEARDTIISTAHRNYLACTAPRNDAPRSSGMYGAAERCAVQRSLSPQIRAPHESELLLNMIEKPVVRFEALLGHLFHLGHRVEMHLQIEALPALLAQGDETLDRAALLLPTGIGESFCDRPLGKIKEVGKTERHEVGGKAAEIADTIIEKLFQFGREIDRVALRLHRFNVSPDVTLL